MTTWIWLRRFSHLEFIHSFVIRHLRQHVGSAARVINNAVRFEQGGNHGNALRTRVDHLLKIVDVNSADTKDRDIDVEMNLPDVAQPDWLVIWFCWRGEDRTKSDVIGAFAQRRVRLGQTVRRFSNNQISSSFLACNKNRIVVLSNVHAFDGNPRRDLRIIIHDQRRVRAGCDLMDLRGEIDQFVDRFSFSAQLDEIYTTSDHLFRDAIAIPQLRDVTEINDSVKAAFA